jgi:hypothetical protein
VIWISRIWGSQSRGYGEYYLPGYNAVYFVCVNNSCVIARQFPLKTLDPLAVFHNISPLLLFLRWDEAESRGTEPAVTPLHQPSRVNEGIAALVEKCERRTEVLGEKPGPVPLLPHKHCMRAQGLNPSLRGEKPTTICPNSDTSSITRRKLPQKHKRSLLNVACSLRPSSYAAVNLSNHTPISQCGVAALNGSP